LQRALCRNRFRLGGCESPAWASSITTECSYYTYNSCIREGTSGVWTASGERFDENDFTAASWDYKFGTLLRVTNQRNGRSVVVRVNDRGPSKRLYKNGRCLDLSKAAFEAIAPIKSGLATVTVEVI
jgi:rare lipoprotein A